MNLFENLQLLNEAEHDIKISYDNSKPLFEMAKLMNEELDKSLFNDLDCRFIYFSQAQSGHGPRIKFDGGTSETHDSDKAPTMSFDLYGSKDIILQPWMNKKNCPNAFNKR